MSTKSAQVVISVLHSEQFTAAEVPSASTVSERTLRSGKGNDAQLAFSESSTPAVTKPAISQKITLGGSATVIDLTAVAAAAIPAAATRTVDQTGGKLVSFNLRADSENTDPITVGPGASSNTYNLFGAGKDIDIEPGFQIGGTFRDVASSLPAVAAGAKNIEVSGTSGDILYLDLLFGT